MGDQTNSDSAQRDLEAVWKDALPTEPLLHRAKR